MVNKFLCFIPVWGFFKCLDLDGSRGIAEFPGGQVADTFFPGPVSRLVFVPDFGQERDTISLYEISDDSAAKSLSCCWGTADENGFGRFCQQRRGQCLFG